MSPDPNYRYTIRTEGRDMFATQVLYMIVTLVIDMGYMASKIVNFIIVLCLILAIFVAFHSTTSERPDGMTSERPDGHLKFETVDSNEDSIFRLGEETYVFRRYDEWHYFWRSFKGEDSPVPPLSEGKEMIIVATTGLKPSSGWTVAVTAIVENEDHIEVFISDIPPQEELVLDVITSPYQIVRTEYSEKEVIFTVMRSEKNP